MNGFYVQLEDLYYECIRKMSLRYFYFLTVDISVTLLKREGTRHVGKPKLGWLEPVEEDLKNVDVRNWRRKSRDQEEWRTILEEAKVHQEL
jgi:hypothetical protein